MNNTALATVPPSGLGEYVDWDERKRLFIQAVARQATPAQVDVVIAICRELGMNPLTNHINLIDGQAYITHKGLLHVAHRSGQLNGIVILDQGETETHYTATVAVYRKDMDHAFTYPGRYPKSGRSKAYGPEMALTRAETMALRRAFDVALGVIEEPNETSDAARPQQAQQAQQATVCVLPLQANQELFEDVADGMADAEFQTLRRTLAQMGMDGFVAEELVTFVKSQSELLSPAQMQQLRRDYKTLVDGRKDTTAAAPAEDSAPADNPAPPPATPTAAPVAHIEAIKALCTLKHIPLAEVLEHFAEERLDDLQKARAAEIVGWLQTQQLRAAVAD